MQSTVQKILCTILLLSLGLLSVPHVFAVVGDIQLDVSAGGQIIGSALTTNKFTDAANTDYYLDPAAATTSLTVAGSVGIGTATPAAKLQVDTSSNVVGYLFRSQAADGENTDLYIGKAAATAQSAGLGYHYDTTAADTYFYISNYGDSAGTGLVVQKGGSVGIGTTVPGTKLDVVGTVTWTGGNSSHLGTGINVTTYVGNSSVNNALVRSNDNNNDAWVMNWGDSAIWGIYNRNIDSTLVVAGALDVPANSTAFIGGGLAKAYIEHASGNAGFAGQVTANSFSGPLACPSGWNSIAGGRLCHDPTVRGPSTMWVAIGVCAGLQAHVCEHNDMQQACGVINPYAGSAVTGWYGDHARVEPSGNTDDEFLTYNRNTCDVNNDGPGAEASTSLNYFCCQ